MANPTTTLEALFKPSGLSTAVRRYAESLPTTFWNLYRRGEPLSPMGDTVGWDELQYSRDLAPLVGRDDPSTATKKVKRIKRSAPLLDVKEHVDLPAHWLLHYNGPGQDMPNAAAELATNLQNVTNRIMNTVEWICNRSMTTTGGAVDLSTVPNSQITGTLTYPSAALASGASWATASTKIRSTEVNAIRDTYRKNTNRPAARAIGSDTVEGYIFANTEVQAFLGDNPIAAAAVQRSFEEETSFRLGGLDWMFINEFYATDAAPTTEVEIAADADQLVILPAASLDSELFALAEGQQAIPAGRVAGGVGQALSLLQTVRGFYSYVELTMNPVGLRLHAGYRFVPIQKVQEGVLVYDTTP